MVVDLVGKEIYGDIHATMQRWIGWGNHRRGYVTEVNSSYRPHRPHRLHSFLPLSFFTAFLHVDQDVTYRERPEEMIYFTSRMRVSVALLFLGVIVVLASDLSNYVEELTDGNFDEQTKGKVVFIKFYAPWCHHSKVLRPTWQRLTEQYIRNKTTLISQVNCDVRGTKKLCNYNGVQGTPKLMYGQPQNLKLYKGNYEYSTLKTFVDKNLRPLCSPEFIEFCEPEEASAIQQFSTYDDQKLDEEIRAEEGEIAKINADFQTKVDEMERQHSEWTIERDSKIDAIKTGKLALLRAVKAAGASTRKNIQYESQEEQLEKEYNEML